MKSNITLRAPILALASFVLIQNVGVVKAQSITAVAVTLPTNDNILTTFTHSALAATDSVTRSYFTAGCVAPLTLAGTDFETLALATAGGTSSSVTNKISQIYDEMDINTIAPSGGPSGATRGEQFIYCVRLTHTTAAGISDFLEVDITYNAYFDEDNIPLGGTVTGSSNNPDGGTVDSSLLTVSVFTCDGAGTVVDPATVLEGATQRFCVYADQHPTTGMLSIDTFSFSGTPTGGDTQTQQAITTGNPADGLTTAETCSAGAAFCAFSTTLKGEFYLQSSGQRVTAPTPIAGVGTATIRIGGTVRKARVLLMLRNGDQVVKETSEVEFLAAPKEEEKEECDCSDTFFLFWIFCWIFNCLFGL
jgi:hypothetical protein